jgi:hypothetical protein
MPPIYGYACPPKHELKQVQSVFLSSKKNQARPKEASTIQGHLGMIVLEWPWTLHAYVTITIPVSKVQSFPNGIKRVGEELAKPINTKQTAHVYCSLL